MTYARRYIDVTFVGQKNIKFNARGKYALRTSAKILMAGGYNLGSLSLQLRGLTLDHMNEMSTLGVRIHPNYNYHVIVEAGDDVNGMSKVFEGGIQQAWADMKAMPDCPFHVIASAGGGAVTMRTPPSSYEGSTDVVPILEDLAKRAGLGFENYGVKERIDNPHFTGSPWRQMKEIIDAANIDGVIENGKLIVWSKNDGRSGDTLFISRTTGLRDYPAWTEYGVQVRTEFRKAIAYGGTMNIESDITPANGEWRIIRIDYDLQANTPGGSWYAILDGAKMGSPTTMPPS